MKNFFDQGIEGEFKYFSLAHFIPLILLGLVIFLIVKYHEKIRKFKYEETLRYTMCFIMLMADMSYFWHRLHVGGNIRDHLPITICGWACIIGGLSLATKNEKFFAVNYFLVFSASVFSLITPVVITSTGPTHFRYYQFWIEHTMIFIAPIYLIFVHKMRPTIKLMIPPLVVLLILSVLAITVNTNIDGANYLFLANVKEAGGSLLDILPRNLIVKMFIMLLVFCMFFALSYLPWYLKDRKNSLNQFEKAN